MNKAKKIMIAIGCFFILFIGLTYIGGRFLWGEHFLYFFAGFFRNPFRVGAFTPASRFVTKEITKYVEQIPPYEHTYILEVGAGSGVFTGKLERILENRNTPYTLDVIEIDPGYCALLEKQFGKNKNLHIYCTDITRWNPPYNYHAIVSALPFATLPLNLVQKTLQLYKTILQPNGTLSYYEHMWLPRLKQHFLHGSVKKQYMKKLAYLKEFRKKFVFQTDSVWANITPVYVHHARFASQKPTS